MHWSTDNNGWTVPLPSWPVRYRGLPLPHNDSVTWQWRTAQLLSARPEEFPAPGACATASEIWIDRSHTGSPWSPSMLRPPATATRCLPPAELQSVSGIGRVLSCLDALCLHLHCIAGTAAASHISSRAGSSHLALLSYTLDRSSSACNRNSPINANCHSKCRFRVATMLCRCGQETARSSTPSSTRPHANNLAIWPERLNREKATSRLKKKKKNSNEKQKRNRNRNTAAAEANTPWCAWTDSASL